MNETSYIVLLFHSIDDRDLLSFKDLGNIHPGLFEKTLLLLKKDFDIVSLEEFVGCISAGQEREGRLLAVTFDDGPKSYAFNAVPIMESLGIPSTCFLITDCIGDDKIYWRYLYNFCIQSGHGTELAALINREYGVSIMSEDIVSFTRKRFNRQSTMRIMKQITSQIIPEEEYREREKGLFLSLDDIETLRENPLVDFGIHSRTHPVFLSMSDQEICDEISGSIRLYNKSISDAVPMFSIPFGRLYRDYDERALKIARDLSIDVILSAYGGDNRTDQPLFNIRRIPVYEGMLKDGTSFISLLNELRLAGNYSEREKRLYDAVK
jgi:peptidoglycan/xylan/chitin deacetylase (PgdA/CDA1 family)